MSHVIYRTRGECPAGNSSVRLVTQRGVEEFTRTDRTEVERFFRYTVVWPQ